MAIREEVRALLLNLDLCSFLDSIDISYELTAKNVGQGWIGIEECPFCGQGNFHLGLNLVNKVMNCWVCGTRGTLVKFLMKTRNIDMNEALDLIKAHSNGDTEIEDIEQRVKTILKPVEHKYPYENLKKTFNMPGDPVTIDLIRTMPRLQAFMMKRHLTLEICQRHKFLYDWEKSLRLVMPIWDNEGTPFAYTARDITGRALLRYIVKPDGINLGKVLYNLNNYDKHEYIIGVEGILDAVRVEYLVEKYVDIKYLVVAFNTSNPSSTHLSLLSKLKIKKFFAMFDRDSWFKYKALLDLPYDVEHVILPLGVDPNQLRKDEFLDLSFWRSE